MVVIEKIIREALFIWNGKFGRDLSRKTFRLAPELDSVGPNGFEWRFVNQNFFYLG